METPYQEPYALAESCHRLGRRSSTRFGPKCADAFREILIRSPLLAVSHAATRGVPPTAGGSNPTEGPGLALTAVLTVEGVSDKHPTFWLSNSPLLIARGAHPAGGHQPDWAFSRLW